MSSAKWRLLCLGINVLIQYSEQVHLKKSYHNSSAFAVSQWRHNGHDGVSNHQSHHCVRNRLFKRRLKKTSKLHATGLCVGNSPVTGEFPIQMASNEENVSIWWRHHDKGCLFKHWGRNKWLTLKPIFSSPLICMEILYQMLHLTSTFIPKDRINDKPLFFFRIIS